MKQQPAAQERLQWPLRHESQRKARGLTEAVLQAIRTDVFNVAAPIGP